MHRPGLCPGPLTLQTDKVSEPHEPHLLLPLNSSCGHITVSILWATHVRLHAVCCAQQVTAVVNADIYERHLGKDQCPIC